MKTKTMPLMRCLPFPRSAREVPALFRRAVPLVLAVVLLLLAAFSASAQGKYDPYGEPVPTSLGGAVLPDADNPADPAGTPVPAPGDKPAPTPPASFVHASGGHFAVDGQPFRHVGVNEAEFAYEGGTTNNDQWNDTWTLRQGGVKQIRIILANSALDESQVLDKLDNALGVAWSRGIRITVAFTNFYYDNHWGHDANGGYTAVPGDAPAMNHPGYYTDTCCNGVHILNHDWIAGGYNDYYKPFVHAVVSRFAGDGRIFAWEIGNEIGAPQNDTARAIAFYRDMAQFIKGIDPNHMVSTGIICSRWLGATDWAQKVSLYELMDYVVEHHYDPNSPNPGDLDENLIAAWLGKPLVIEEYGVSQWQTPYSVDHDLIMPAVSDFFDQRYANDPFKPADAIMIWGVDFGNDLGSDDQQFGPTSQNLVNDYLQLWRETADWARVSPRYSDVPPGNAFYSYIECLSSHRAVNGLFSWVNDQHDNEYRPGESITRADAVKDLVRAMGFTLQFPATPTFTDVPRSSPYYRYIETAVRLGILSGYDDHTFRPDNHLTRGQMCKVIVLAGMAKYGWLIDTSHGQHFTDVPPSQPFFPFVETAYNLHLVSGYGDYFAPGNEATRGQFAKVLAGAISCNPAL